MEPVLTISFSEEDVGNTKMPHDDPQMNIPSDILPKIDTPLYGASNHPVVCERIIALPVTVGALLAQAKLMLDFMVMRVPSAYNAILGRTTLNQLRAVVSTYHMKMKFSTEHGIGEVKGDQVKDFAWTEECQKSFEGLKHYLASPPLLTKPVAGEDLFLYLSVSEVAVSTVLIREEKGKQKPIYYVSKVLQDVATRFPQLDRVVFALVTSAKKLRPYFQSHTIIVLTDQPLGKVLQSLDASRRLVNWSVELGEFDIKYKPRAAIKVQALSDFIVEGTVPEDHPHLILSKTSNPWLLYVDGLSKTGSNGTGLILISP
ncbi:hypothetical protein RJ639_044779 [Escallonia herrerae]|uniref:Reverse transcriptase/retrotransposon-derived protein RNase H-like domain-containing protein n=1 Tax=Escallonia herrerae TaxID=1293975 RepID=A0AA88WCU3_9ASTE|nr:hypothetical protein RJ639_044779 [Escallonia herrerae]